MANLLVTIEDLESYSEELSNEKAKLIELMTKAKSEMESISGEWADDSGSLMISKFSDFITSGIKLCDEMESLKGWTTKHSGLYRDALNTYVPLIK